MSNIELNLSITDHMGDLLKALDAIVAKEVLVGFPDDGKAREDENGNPTPITNAAIAYVQDRGSPEANIPARPFMVPGIESRQDSIADGMKHVIVAALDGQRQATDLSLHMVGTIARDAIKAKILDGPFEPLAESTLRSRQAHGGDIGKAAGEELSRRKAGEDPGVDLSRPLNRSGQLRQGVEYLIRNSK